MSTKKPISKAIFYKDLYITIYGMNVVHHGITAKK